MTPMMLADTADVSKLVYPGTAVVSTLDGVTTALVAFVILGLVYPQIVKKSSQFYMVLASVLVLIALHTLTLILRSGGGTVFTGVLTGVTQMVGLGLAVMCTGGMGAKQLAGELHRSYEVMRRGEEEKEVIIPINMPKKEEDDGGGRVVYTIDTPPGPAQTTPHSGSIPLE